MQRNFLTLPRPQRSRQRGVALFVVIIVVMLSMLLALWASRTSIFNEMVVGNDADYQRAFEAAQALIQDAELDIRGENPDGSACVAANCRDKVAGAALIPLTGPEITPLLAALDTKTTKCQTGLCTKRTGRQDFWNYTSATSPAPTGLKSGEVTLEAMTAAGIGARYGEYSGAVVGAAGTANPILADVSADNQGGWYWIEVMHYDESKKNNALIVNPDVKQNLLGLKLNPNVVYRITALAYGRKAGTMAVIQQVYARQKPDI